MPDNQIPATQPEPGAAPEFDFAQPAAENPRIKRRSLKAKGSSLKPAAGTPHAARELEHEAPPLSAEQATQPRTPVSEQPKVEPAAKRVETPAAPPRTTPAMAAMAARSAQAAAASTASAAPKNPTAPAAAPTSNSSTTSPHGTRPATLYYSSNPRKADNPSPMKTIPTAAAPSASSATTMPSSATRPATTASRPAANIDYRANVERQSREQKSVGNILTYVVYGFIALFVLSAGLAIYGADVIFKQLHDQSLTVSDLDARYAAANKDLNAKLATTQDTLTQAQAQIKRQQDLIVTQQEELNRLIASTTDNAVAIKSEKQARAQETANLRGQVRDLQNRTTTQKF